MFGNIASMNPNVTSNKIPAVTIAEVIPASAPERCACSYCGKAKLAAFHLVTDDSRKGVVCYPCADQGMHWLEKNFPG